jgi:ABC-2 type transport system permease protein
MWKVAVAEFSRLARKRSFVLSLIAMPIFIGAIAAIAVVTAMPRGDDRPLGYVDLAGVTQAETPAGFEPSERVQLIPFADEAAAQGTLQAGEIQAFYVIPADYLETRQVRLYTWGESPSGGVRGAFEDFLTAHLVAQAPAEAQTVLLEGVSLNFRAANDRREMPAEGFVVSMLLPFVIGFFFIMVVMTSGGYLLQAVTTEKENRMVEIMMTSISPLQLIAGKALGLIGVALTQIGVWLFALAVALVWGSSQVEWLREIRVPVDTIALAALFFIPTYVLLAGMMITIGCIVTELQHGQQISGFFNLLFALPFFFIVLMFTNPDSPIMIILTLFPTTSLMAIAMRWGVTAIPTWQVVLGFVILVASALGSLWVAARVFRLGMLSYGQPLTLTSLLKQLKPGRTPAAAGSAGRMAA